MVSKCWTPSGALIGSVDGRLQNERAVRRRTLHKQLERGGGRYLCVNSARCSGPKSRPCWRIRWRTTGQATRARTYAYAWIVRPRLKHSKDANTTQDWWSTAYPTSASSAISFNGPESAVEIVNYQMKAKIGRYSKKNQQHTRYETLAGMRQTQAFIAGSSRGLEECLLELRKKDLKLVVGLLMGHCHLKRQLQILATSETGTCRKCEEEKDSPILVLCHCPVLIERRFKKLCVYVREPEGIAELSLRSLVAFVRRHWSWHRHKTESI